VGRGLGSAVRAAARSRRHSSRSVRLALNLVEEAIDLGAGLRLSILRPPSADELIDEATFDEEEFLPYWAELWPSGVALARYVATRDVAGWRVLELGCGLGLPSLAAALSGADVFATDWAEDAIELLRQNAARNGALLGVERVRWSEPEPLLRAAPWDLVLGADLLYEERNAAQLATLLPQLICPAETAAKPPSPRSPRSVQPTRGRGEIILAEPGRPYAQDFLDRFHAEPVGERLYRLAC
jgi:2-polyprenyl-3-methyl-5-hydroxy-6-metoxy-1,4-benzoquinol methylase